MKMKTNDFLSPLHNSKGFTFVESAMSALLLGLLVALLGSGFSLFQKRIVVLEQNEQKGRAVASLMDSYARLSYYQLSQSTPDTQTMVGGVAVLELDDRLSKANMAYSRDEFYANAEDCPTCEGAVGVYAMRSPIPGLYEVYYQARDGKNTRTWMTLSIQ